MARTVNEDEYRAKRDEILDEAIRLVLTKGYQRMTIQNILDGLRISKGAFYHYFDSREALLAAFIARMLGEVERPLLPIIHDSRLSALEKLQGFFDTLARLRIAHRADVVRLGRVWYTDDNAIVREKVSEALRAQRAPLLTEVVRQGVREGVFTTAHPEQSGEIILSLLQGMESTHARLMLASAQARDGERCIEAIVATHAATMDAIERVLGAPARSLSRVDAAAVEPWVRLLRDDRRARRRGRASSREGDRS